MLASDISDGSSVETQTYRMHAHRHMASTRANIPLQTFGFVWFARQMAYFRDLSPYEYRPVTVPGAQNVGWLAPGHPFETQQALENDLDLLWAHCKVAINVLRGLHPCAFCPDWSPEGFRVMRSGETLMLGYSEIRVIGPSGQSYAAPSLIYHYVNHHNYKPPDVFLCALRTGPRPPSEAYFEELRTRELEWGLTFR